MSAFVVSHNHINALLTFARERKMQDRLSYIATRGTTTPQDWSTIGKILLAENERSVCHRYPDCTPGDAPGKIGEEAIGYEFKPWSPLLAMPHTKKLATILKACDCFDYQACETDDYESSIAWQIVDAIRGNAIRLLPGYDEAPWGIG